MPLLSLRAFVAYERVKPIAPQAVKTSPYIERNTAV